LLRGALQRKPIPAVPAAEIAFGLGRFFSELVAVWTVKDVKGVTFVLRNEGAGGEIKLGPTRSTALSLNPEEILHDGIRGVAHCTGRPVEKTNRCFKISNDGFCSCAEGTSVERGKLLTDYPVRELVHVTANNVHAETICLKKGGPATHERIENGQPT